MSNYFLFIGLLFSITLCHAQCPTIIGSVPYPNLPQLTNSGPVGQGDWQMTGSDGNLYNWNFCATQTFCPSDCGTPGTVVCQSCATSPRSLGVLAAQFISIVPGVNSVSFVYLQGSFSSGCGVNRNSNITVACVTSGSTSVIAVTADPNCLTTILMKSPYACPGQPTTTTHATTTTMSYPPLVAEQALAMSDLQSAWGASLGWTGMASSRACYWPGVSCGVAGIFSFVISLDVSNAGLAAPIPASITNLASLSYLNVSLNKLGGSLPANFSALSELKVLDCSYAGLEGDFPMSIFSSGALEIAMLQVNAFTGSLPTSICQVEYYNAQGNLWNCPLPNCCSLSGNYFCVPCVNANGIKQTGIKQTL